MSSTKASEAVRERRRVRVPVAQSPGVVVAAGEPSVVDDEQFGADVGGQLGQLQLAGRVDVEAGGLPGVVEHLAGAVQSLAGEVAFVAVPDAGEPVEAVGAEGAGEAGGGEGVAGGQMYDALVRDPPGADAHAAARLCLGGDVPVAGPFEGDAMGRLGLPVLHGEPGRVRVSGRALEAAHGERSPGQVELGALELLGPLACEVGQPGCTRDGDVHGGRVESLQAQFLPWRSVRSSGGSRPCPEPSRSRGPYAVPGRRR